MLEDSVDLLILGAGWTSSFLLPLLQSDHRDITYAYTTRDGRDGSIKWSWDAESMTAPFSALPSAKTVLITFPLKGQGQSKAFVQGYTRAHHKKPTKWIQLGSTGIFDGGPTLHGFKWTDRHSDYDRTNARAIAEDELMQLESGSYVLDLAGLWGGARDVFNWLPRVSPSKEVLGSKKSVHLIHGYDVARAIVAVHLAPRKQDGKRGERYILTDLQVYDWWSIAQAFTAPDYLDKRGVPPETRARYEQIRTWLNELLQENEVRKLPRPVEQLGRALDSKEFWHDFKLSPVKGLLEKEKL